MAAQPRPGTIERAPDRAAGADHDLIVVGGGIYGIALALEAARRGLRALLVERADYGGATSWSNLRILHGGLRYLQSLDLARFYQSVGERRWFLRHFPDLVRPLPCLMPLYGRGLKRPGVFRVALALNDILSWRRNAGVARTLQLPDGRLTGAAETAALFPAVERQGLQGGALWHDAVMLSPERIAIEMLRWACACGASALNYVEATGLLVEGGAVRGILAHDRVGGRELRLRARHGDQCSRPLVARRSPGAWDRTCRRCSGRRWRSTCCWTGRRSPRSPSRSSPGGQAAPTYFCLPWKGLLLAGTSYAAVPEDSLEAAPSEAQVAAFLADLNAAVPGLEATPDDVLQVYAGLLPARAASTTLLASREVIHDHGAAGGPKGLFSVSGVKFTTARLVAQKTLGEGVRPSDASAAARTPRGRRQQRPSAARASWTARSPLDGPIEQVRARLRALAEQEAVLGLDDLLFRRLDFDVCRARPRRAGTRAAAARLG